MDIALKATLLFAFTALVLGLLRRSGAAARHLAGTAGLIGALALPLLTLALPLGSPRAPRPVRSPAIPVSSFEVADSQRSDPAPDPRWERVKDNAMETGAPVAPLRPRGQSVPWPLVALAAWSAGALAIASRLAVGLLRVRGIRRESAPLDDPEWKEETRRLARQLEVQRPVALLESDRVPVAMTSGLRRPLLLLCRQARFWAVERRRVVLLHELAHVRRADWLWLLLAEAALAIYWWHPLAWVLARQVRRDCERACDDLVLTAGTKPSVYAGHLLGIFRSLSAAAHPVAPAVASASIPFRGAPAGDPRSGGFAPRAPERPRFCFRRGSLRRRGRDRGRPTLDAGLRQRGDPESLRRYRGDRGASGRQGQGAVQGFEEGKVKDGRADLRGASVSSSASVSASASPTETAVSAPEEPLPESGRTLPAVMKAIGVMKEATTGFVRASNEGWSKSKRDGGDWYSRGMSFHHRERYDEAIEAFQKAIEAGYREDAATYNIACGYALKGDRDKAFEWLRKAEEAGFDVASYLERDDDLDSLKSDPRWKAMKNAAQQHPSARQEREGAAAAKRYERIASGAGSGEASFDVGKQLLNAGRFDLSAKAFQNAADQGYRVGTSLYNEACALSRGGQTRAALDVLQKALDAGFDQPDIFRKDDDLDNVRDDPRFAEIEREARDLSLPGYNNWTLGSNRNRSRWRDAARKFEDYARAHPQKGRAWFNVGYASLAGDRPEAAVEAFKKALDLGYRKPTTMYNLACSYARLDQKDPAFDWLFKALDAGFDGTGTLRGDDDLDNLRGDPRYRKALSIARAREKSDDD